MGDVRYGAGLRVNSAVREAVRSQIVVHGLYGSREISEALGITVPTIARILRRFEAVDVLTLLMSPRRPDDLRVDPDSLTDRFRDLAKPLW